MINEVRVGELMSDVEAIRETYPFLKTCDLLQIAIALKTSAALNQIDSRLDSMISKLDQVVDAIDNLTPDVQHFQQPPPA